MASLTSLLEFYYESMQQELRTLEEQRLSLLQHLRTRALILALLALFGLVVLHQYAHFSFLQALLLSVFSAAFLFAILYRREKVGFDLLFKTSVIEKLIHFIDPSLCYTTQEKIAESAYRQSELFIESYDRYEGSDLVSGQIEQVNVRFSCLHVEKKERDRENKEHWNDVFQGIFFMAEFNKPFHTKTVVLPDFAEKTLGVLGSWMQSLNSTRGKLIKLDHVAFEKLFVVYADDPIESRYILSHALMEKIVDFQHKMNKPIYLSFVNAYIYIAIPYTKSMFEPILTRSLMEFTYIKEYFELLNTMIGIVEELKLNEKLWG